MKVVAIIPARYASTRLPGKPLLAATGKPLIQHVCEAARQASLLDAIYVATDDQRIFDAVKAFGGQAVMTRSDHATGTDRLAEAANLIGLADEDIVVNVQGDEPEINPRYIDALVLLLSENDAPMATLAAPMDPAAAANPNKVKVVLACDGHALYFSRARIPYDRDDIGAEHLLHMGMYAYRKSFLLKYARLSSTPAERAEKLEQLRALENGYKIMVGVAEAPTPGIDTPEDYAAFVARMKKTT